MKKLLLRIIVWGSVGVLALIVCLEGILAYVSRTEWFKTQVTSILESTLGRDIDLTDMGANLRGVYVDDLRIAEQGGFENGTFAELDRLRIHLSWWHLLHGHARVDSIILSNVTVRLTVQEDGTPSWADLMAEDSTEQPPSADDNSLPFGLDVTAQRVRLEQLYVQYIDKVQGHTAEIDGVTIDVRDFSLQEPFDVQIFGHVLDQTSNVQVEIPVTLQAVVQLHDLDLEKAQVEITKLAASYQGTTATLSGSVSNWIYPQALLELVVHNVSQRTFAAWIDMPKMQLDTLRATAKLALNLDKQSLTLHHLKLTVPGVEIAGKGGYLYATKQPTYAFSVQINSVLGELGRWLPLVADPYRLVGTVQADIQATQQQLNAQFKVDEVGVLVPYAGRFSNITGQLSGWEAMNFTNGQWKTNLDGKFQGSPLSLKLDVTQTAKKIEAVLKAYAKELAWQQPPSMEDLAAEDASAPVLTQEDSTPWPYPPLDLKADVQIDQLQAPYLYGTQFKFTSDMAGLTPNLKQAHGVLRLTTQNGKIQDLYKLTNDSPLTKVLFISLNITSKVFNSLNVWGVLKKIGGGVTQAVTKHPKKEDVSAPVGVKTQTILGPDGEPLEVEVEEAPEVGGGEMVYDKFDTQVDFVNGKATIKQGTFVSPLMSFRIDGTTDFNSGVVDFRVHAAPGRHEVNGMMPLSLKIGGTVDEPTGNMQVLGSVASLLKQSVTNNVVSRNVTKGVKGLFGLFKKKEEVEPTESELAEDPGPGPTIP